MTLHTQNRRKPYNADWLTVLEAERITSESAAIWKQRAVEEAAAAQREGRAPKAMQARLPRGRGRMIWFLRRDYDDRLAFDPDAESPNDPRLELFRPAQIKRAQRRFRWLMRWQKLIIANAGTGATRLALAKQVAREAKRAEGKWSRISWRSLQMWAAKYPTMGSDGRMLGIIGLIDHYWNGRGRRPRFE